MPFPADIREKPGKSGSGRRGHWFHRILLQVALRTESGQLVRVPSPLDAPVKVERKRRLASEHFRALCEALSASLGFRITPFGQHMDAWFAAWGRVPPKHATALLSEKELEPYKFVWGWKGPQGGTP
ncbi:MAG: hypothetical protein ACUVS7_12185 [Bryobacteraceae bacterium]